MQGLGLDPRDLRDRHLVERPSGRDRASRRLGVVRQPFDSQHESVAQRLRRGAAGRRARRPAAPRCKAGCPRSGRRAARPMARSGVSPRMSASASASSRRSNGASSSRRTCSRRSSSDSSEPQRVAAVKLVGPVAQEQHHPLATQAAGQEVDEGPRGAIRPVQILQRENQDVIVAQQVDQLQQRLEQPRLRGRVIPVGRSGLLVEPRKQRGELSARGPAERSERGCAATDERAQRPDQRRVRKLTVGLLDGFAAEHDHLVFVRLGHPSLEFPNQPGLADAGLDHRAAPLPGAARLHHVRRAPAPRVPRCVPRSDLR